MTAKEYLNRLIELEGDIKRKYMRIRTLRGVVSSTSARMNSEVVQETKDAHQLERIMVEIVDLENEIKNDEALLNELKKDLWTKLELLDDERHKRILWLHYAECKSWSVIGSDINFTPRYARKLHIAALENFEKIL